MAPYAAIARIHVQPPCKKEGGRGDKVPLAALHHQPQFPSRTPSHTPSVIPLEHCTLNPTVIERGEEIGRWTNVTLAQRPGWLIKRPRCRQVSPVGECHIGGDLCGGGTADKCAGLEPSALDGIGGADTGKPAGKPTGVRISPSAPMEG